MKKYLIVFLLLYASCSQKPDAQKMLKPKQTGGDLPSFSLLLTDSITPFTDQNLKTGHPIFLIYMSPTCPYCKMETRRIVNNIEQLQHVQFLLFTEKGKLRKLKEFSKEFDIDKYTNVFAAIDTSGALIRHFRPMATPFTIVYDKNKKLKQIYSGSMSKKLILEASKIEIIAQI